MKKILLTLLVLTFASSICFAAQSTALTTKQPPSKTAEIKAITGKVDSVVLEDTSKGIKPSITILDNKEVKHKFLITASTVINDAGAKSITLDKIAKGDKVLVKYHKNKEGVKEAVSINLLK